MDQYTEWFHVYKEVKRTLSHSVEVLDALI